MFTKHTKSDDSLQARNNLLYETETNPSRYIADNAGDCVVVVHPDILISGTRISEALDCERKAVLGEQFNSSTAKSPAMLLGTILHELFERGLRGDGFSDAALRRATDELLIEFLDRLLTLHSALFH